MLDGRSSALTAGGVYHSVGNIAGIYNLHYLVQATTTNKTSVCCVTELLVCDDLLGLPRASTGVGPPVIWTDQTVDTLQIIPGEVICSRDLLVRTETSAAH